MALLAMATTSQAVELARVEGFGPTSRGLVGGGLALPVGVAASMLNPAELLRMDGDAGWHVQLTRYRPAVDVSHSATGEQVRSLALDKNRGPYFLPEFGWGMRRGNLAFGTGVYAAGGFGIEYGTQSFLSRTTTNNVATGLPVSSRIGQMRIPLAVGWQAAPRVRLGASLDIVNASMNLASLLDVQQVGLLNQAGRVEGTLVPVLLGVPNLSGAHFEFIRDDILASELEGWGVAGRIAVSVDVGPRTTLAASYETETALEALEGHGRLTAVDSSNNQVVLQGAGRLPAFQFPQAWVLGLSHRLSPKLTVVADLRRTYWNHVLGDTVVAFDDDNGGNLRVSLPTGFNHMTTVSVGGVWEAAPGWTLRSGIAQGLQDTVPGEHLNGTFPTLLNRHIGLGLGWQLPRSALTLHYTFVYIESDTIRNPGGNINSIPPIESQNRDHNSVLSLSYRY